MWVVAIMLGAFSPATSSAQKGDEKGAWILIHKGVEVEKKQKDGTIKKELGGVSGIWADRLNGDLFLFIDGAGLHKSADQGKTCNLVYAATNGFVKAAPKQCMDPNASGRMICFLLKGPSAMTLDGWKTAIPVKASGDSVIVAWNDPEARTILYQNGGHESPHISLDQGNTWPISTWDGVFGFFDRQTWIKGRWDKIQRSEDSGATWKQDVQSNFRFRSALYTFKDCACCFASVDQKSDKPRNLAMTKDKGKTWDLLPLPDFEGNTLLFGQDASHLMAVDVIKGFFESQDGGKTWKNVISTFPVARKDFPSRGDHGGWACYAWDPIHDICYFTTPGMPAYKWLR